MISREKYAEIIALAAHAPSGDNAQPWRFIVHEKSDTVEIYNIPGKDSSPYNFKERGSFFAHGAVIENLVMLFSAEGYSAEVSLFPAQNGDCVAHIALLKKEPTHEPLVAFIPFRRTNRKPYKKIPLKNDDRQALLDIATEFGFGRLHTLEDSVQMIRLGKILSFSDQLIFEDKSIHDAIFSSIRWTPKDEEGRKGLYIKTLELPPPAQVIFKLLNNWSVLSILNKVNISHVIASQSAAGYGASSMFCMITIPSDGRDDFVKAGRLFQQLWLTATEQGIDLQPVTALPYLAQRVHAKAVLDLSLVHQEKILDAEKNIRTLFNAPNETIAMIFRVGYGKKPSAQSKKSVPEIMYD